ncbi:MAG: ABC transporter permease [Planctomycetota bacterium]|jgi:putative xylitol transport system permease protein|nr:ABC transporter permease [Planctomycetota bacterium]
MAGDSDGTGGFARFTQFIWELRIIIALGVICMALSFASPYFLLERNLINVLRQVSVNGLLSIGMTFIILTGGIDLSVGSILAFGGVVAASFVSTAYKDVPSIHHLGAIGLGLLAGVLLGTVNGLVISRIRVTPFIMTLGMLSIARGLTFIYTNGMPVTDLSRDYLWFGQGGWSIYGDWFLPVPVVVFLLAFLVAWIVLYYTKFGRYVYAVGGNARSARISGINVGFVIFMVYVISGFLCALGGILLTARTSAGLPQAGVAYELDAIAAVVIGGTSMTGGKGSLLGTLMGVLIIGVINNGLDLLSVSSYYQQVVKGLIIVGAVMLDYFQADSDR